MPLRADAGLWWNLPGVVAAYQPVRAPGPLLARYNMAHGRDNRYRATDGVAPAWSGAAGWTFTARSQWLNSGILPAVSWTALIRLSGVAGDGNYYAFGTYAASGATHFSIQPIYFARIYYLNGAALSVAPEQTAGVIGFAGKTAYRNGVPDGTIGAGSASITVPVAIGNLNYSGRTYGILGSVPAFAIYARTLSSAEVWTVSRQMAYCDVNPDWSVWGRRRQWFYGPQVGSAQALALAGSLTASGAAQRATATGMLGSLTGSGTAQKSTGAMLAGSVTGSGIVASLRTRLLALAGSLTASGGLLRRAGRNVAGSLTGSGGAIRQTVKGLVGSLTASATLARSRLLFVTLVGSLTGAGGLVRQIGKARPASLTASGAVGRLIGKGLAGLLTGLGGLLASLVPRYKIHVTVAHTRVYQAQGSDGRATVVTVTDAVVG
jgi:hypothetical protein